jgi:aminomethyltransferase
VADHPPSADLAGALRRTPLFDAHVAAGARLIDFGGWHLPVQYEGTLAEHARVRSQVGLFDVSHMGEVRVRGPRALAAVQHLVTNSVDMPDGMAQYTVMCHPSGGIVDDLIVYRIGPEELLICVNAANRSKDFAWMDANNPFPGDAVFTDEGDDWAQLAVQGRGAVPTLAALTPVDVSAIPYYGHAAGPVAGIDGCLIARTGYTGEDGFEVFVPAGAAMDLWAALLRAGAPHGLAPIGLGARDTLRLEARMCLYGNDIDDTTTPWEANLGWTVKMDKPDFIGKAALAASRAAPARSLIGLVVDGRIARHGHVVLIDGAPAGVVTSGSRSPTRGDNIALAYVPRGHGKPGSTLLIDVRGKTAEATVVKGPFYKRDY